MRLPPPAGFASPEGIAAWARRLVGSIASSWAVDHNADGTHKFSWVDLPHDATRFTGLGSMTWAVTSGDQLLMAYRIAGDSCLVAWRIRTTDVGGTPSNRLLIRLPEGIRPTRRVSGGHYYDDAGTEGWGLARLTSDLTQIELFKASSAATWTATAGNNTYSEGSLEFSITQ